MIQFDAPLQGIQDATRRLNTAAAHIASASVAEDQVDLSAEMIALLNARYSVAANVKAEQTMDAVSRTLINILA